MINIITAPDNLIFSSALCLMLLIGVVEALGMGALGGDFDGLDGDGGDSTFGWMSFRQFPLSIVLVLFLATFGLSGFAIQQTATAWTGGTLPALLAAPLALLMAVPATRIFAGALARILPVGETSAVSLETLVGRRGHIVVGTASSGSPARAKVRDAFGHGHHVMVEPHVADVNLLEGDEILLVGRDASTFLAVAVTPHVIFAEGEVA